MTRGARARHPAAIAASSLVAIATLCLGAAVPAAAAPPSPVSLQCGDVVGPGGSYVLTEDVGPCDTQDGPALTLVGPVSLDLRGFRVHCAPYVPRESIAVELSGRGAELAGGAIEDCAIGVALHGEGRHRVESVSFGRFTTSAAVVPTHRNVLTGNQAELSLLAEEGRSAFLVDGDRNRLKGNVVTNGYDGAFLVRGDRNRVLRNHIVYGSIVVVGRGNLVRDNQVDWCGKYNVCVWIRGSGNLLRGNVVESPITIDGEKNRAIANRSVRTLEGVAGFYATGVRHVLRGNDMRGALVLQGSHIRVSGNVVKGPYGYDVAGDHHVLTRNVALNDASYWVPSREQDPTVGFLVDGQGHRLESNSAYGYYRSGFHVVAGSGGNVLSGNESLDNNWDSSLSEFDMREDNPDCGTNRWLDNRFATRNLACIGGSSEPPEEPLALDPVDGPLEMSLVSTLTGTGFTRGSAVQGWAHVGGDLLPFGPLPRLYDEGSRVLRWEVPDSLPIGDGLITLFVVNTDQVDSAFQHVRSEPQTQLFRSAVSIDSVDGVPQNPFDPAAPTPSIDTILVPGATVTLRGSGFLDPRVNLFSTSGNHGPLAPLPGWSEEALQIVLPDDLPTGPGALQVMNHRYVGRTRASAPVSVALGDALDVTSVSQSGSTITVRGTGFSTASILNLFAATDDGTRNLGGLDDEGHPRIAFVLVSAEEIAFDLPAEARPGAASVVVVHPPFNAFSSTLGDPDGRFELVAP